eukprot:GHVT01028324.1.p1 GENE.GHVT01028324.1~~GHVT01028324.1.p1  ORF type:complete len:310 (-),score=42.47 GHVT01028324.1:2237-3166(-)
MEVKQKGDQNEISLTARFGQVECAIDPSTIIELSSWGVLRHHYISTIATYWLFLTNLIEKFNKENPSRELKLEFDKKTFAMIVKKDNKKKIFEMSGAHKDLKPFVHGFLLPKPVQELLIQINRLWYKMLRRPTPEQNIRLLSPELEPPPFSFEGFVSRFFSGHYYPHDDTDHNAKPAPANWEEFSGSALAAASTQQLAPGSVSRKSSLAPGVEDSPGGSLVACGGIGSSPAKAQEAKKKSLWSPKAVFALVLTTTLPMLLLRSGFYLRDKKKKNAARINAVAQSHGPIKSSDEKCCDAPVSKFSTGSGF